MTALEVPQYPIWAARGEGPDLEMIRLLAFLLPFLADLESLLPVLSINSVVNGLYSPLTNGELGHINSLKGLRSFILLWPTS